MKLLLIALFILSTVAWAGAGAAPEGDPAQLAGVKSFGAKGDGLTDDTAAIQNAINAGGTVYLPAGAYKVSALSFPGSVAAIHGDGIGKTVIKFTSGGLKWDLAGMTVPATETPSFSLRDMTLTTTTTNATGIELTGNPKRARMAVSISNVVLEGTAGTSAGLTFWKTGISMKDCKFAVLSNVRLWGNAGHNQINKKAETGIKIFGTPDKDVPQQYPMFGFTLNNIWIWCYATGISANNSVEGIYMSGGEIWEAGTAVDLRRDGSTIAGTAAISNMHLNGSKYSIYANRFYAVSVSNVDLENSTSETDASGEVPVRIYLDEAYHSIINGNRIRGANRDKATGIGTAIFAKDLSRLTISNNLFTAFDREHISLMHVSNASINGNVFGDEHPTPVAIRVNPSSSNIGIGSNTYLGVKTHLVDPSFRTFSLGADSPATTSQSVPGGVGGTLQLINQNIDSGTAVDLIFAPSNAPASRYAKIESTNNGGNGIDLRFFTGLGSNVSEKMRIWPSGGVSVGNDGDPGKGNVSTAGDVTTISGGLRTILSNPRHSRIAAGSLVEPDPSDDGSAVIATANSAKCIGVSATTTSDAVSVVYSGRVNILLKDLTSCNRGDYVSVSDTPGRAICTSSPPATTRDLLTLLGIALQSVPGGSNLHVSTQLKR